MKMILILILLISSFGAAGFADTVASALESGRYNSTPAPRLKYPLYDTVIISGDQPLEFAWWNDWIDTSGFIFRIYKGYHMYADNLILKENLPGHAVSFKLRPGFFEEGEVYTWALIRISFSGIKSERSYNSFRVVKK